MYTAPVMGLQHEWHTMLPAEAGAFSGSFNKRIGGLTDSTTDCEVGLLAEGEAARVGAADSLP